MGKIDGTTITANYFNSKTEEMEEQYKMQNGVAQVPTDVEYQIREQAWQNLLQENLLNKQYEKLGLTVGKDELSDMFVGDFVHPEFMQAYPDPNTRMSMVKYYTENFESLDTMQKTQWIEMENYFKQSRQQQKYINLIAKGFYMPKAIATKIAEYGAKKSDVRVACLTYQSVDNSEVELTDKDYQDYYNKHKSEFKVIDEFRDIDFVVFPVDPTQEDLANIEKDVMRVWEEFQTVEPDELAFFINAESDRYYDSNYVKASTLPAPLDSTISSMGAGSVIAPQIAGNQWIMGKVESTDVRPDSLRASVIWVMNNKVGGNVTRSEEEAKVRTDSVVALVKSGKMSFDEAIAQFSDDPTKNDNHGDMGWQLDGNYGFLNDDIVKTPVDGIFTYEHPQKSGHCIVKVTGKTTPNKKYRVALLTREITPSEKTEKNIYNTANQFAGQNRTYQAMTAAAQEQNLMIRSGRVAMMSSNLPGIANARSIVQWAFNDETEVNAVADQVFEADGMYIVAALKDVYKKGFASLEQVKPGIENMVRIEKKAELLTAKAEEAIKAGGDINQVATKLGVAVDTVAGVGFNDYFFGKFGMEPSILGAVASAKGNGMMKPVKGAQGIYVLNIDNQVTEKTADPEAIRSQMEGTAQQKVNSLIQVLMSNAKIVDQRNKFF